MVRAPCAGPLRATTAVHCFLSCYLQEVPVWRPNPDPVLVAGVAHYLERLRRPRRGRRRHHRAVAADAHELVAEHPEVERRLVDPPQLNQMHVLHGQPNSDQTKITLQQKLVNRRIGQAGVQP